MPNYTGSTLVFGADDTLTTTYSYAKFPVYMKREEGGKVYRFVQFDNGSAVAAVVNNLCYLVTPASGVVTSDESGATGLPFGIFLSVMTDQYYGWVQTKGACTLKTDGTNDIAKGDRLVAKAADGTVTRPTVTTVDPTQAQLLQMLHIVGTATADDDDGAGTVAAYLQLEG